MKTKDIIADIIDALKGELGDGFAMIRTFAEDQSDRIARFALTIAEQRATGDLKTNNSMFNRFVRRLEAQVEAFARHLVALTVLTMEKAWNAVVSVVWGAMNAIVAGTGLPIPIPPVPSV